MDTEQQPGIAEPGFLHRSCQFSAVQVSVSLFKAKLACLQPWAVTQRKQSSGWLSLHRLSGPSPPLGFWKALPGLPVKVPALLHTWEGFREA